MADHDHALKVLVRGAGISVIGIAVTKIIGYVFQVVVARLLGPEGFGVLSLGLMVFSITATLMMLGIPPGVKRFVAKYREEGDEKRERGTIVSGFQIGLSTSLVACAILFFGADWIAVMAFDDPNVAIVLRVLAFALPMRAVLAVSIHSALAYKKIEYKIYARNITEGLVKISVMAVLLYLGWGLLGASFGVLAGWTAAALVGFYFLETRLMSVLRERKPMIRPVRELVSFSAPLIVSNVFGQITSWADVFLVGFFLSSSAVGLYNAALPTAMLLGMVSAAIGSLAVPVLTELYSAGKHKEFGSVYTTATKWIFALVFPGLLLMVLFADHGLGVIYGQEYISSTVSWMPFAISETGLALTMLALGYMLFATTDLSRQAIQATGDTQYNLYLSIIVGGSNVLLNILFIPMFGIIGAALATAVSWVFGAIASIVFVYKILDVLPFSWIFVRVSAAAVLATGLPFVGVQWLTTSPSHSIIFPVFGVFLMLYVSLFLLFGCLERDDAMILNAVEEKIGMEVPFLHGYVTEVAADDDEA